MGSLTQGVFGKSSTRAPRSAPFWENAFPRGGRRGPQHLALLDKGTGGPADRLIRDSGAGQGNPDFTAFSTPERSGPHRDVKGLTAGASPAHTPAAPTGGAQVHKGPLPSPRKLKYKKPPCRTWHPHVSSSVSTLAGGKASLPLEPRLTVQLWEEFKEIVNAWLPRGLQESKLKLKQN
ncbi:hypothetical protein GWK47_041335 [Chionoecetes opilio]|uniref:Uncharacterized protein n=1 Tax=Chionoecetes opilio TaxID=41210 RepID=A0A8J4YBH7_CHIOP|nr:hypothetical protein GWK47_041335 [Chionoecetes opilio]